MIAEGRPYPSFPLSDFPRNDGVRGSSPRVGSRESPANGAFLLKAGSSAAGYGSVLALKPDARVLTAKPGSRSGRVSGKGRQPPPGFVATASFEKE